MSLFGVKRGLMALPLVVGTLLMPAMAQASTNAEAVSAGTAYLAAQQGLDGAIAGDGGVSSWSAIAFEAAGMPIDGVALSGGQSLEAYLLENPPATDAGANEWSRGILAITGAGQNPYDFGGTNYVAHLEASHNGGQIGATSLVNDDAFAVLALVASRVGVADSGLVDGVNFILAHQRLDGGFNYQSDATAPYSGSDVDDSASFLMALVAARDYGVQAVGLDAAITKVTAYILPTQLSDGGFPYDPTTPLDWGGPASDVSTSSWVVMALASLGESGGAPSIGAQAYIRAHQWSDGSFPWMSGAGDVSTTPDVVTAMAGKHWPLMQYAGALPADGGLVLSDLHGASEVTPVPTPFMAAVAPAVASDVADAVRPRIAVATTFDSKAESVPAPAVTPSLAPSPEVLAARTAAVASSKQPPISPLRIALAVGLVLAGVLGPVAYFLRRRFSRP